jgi:lipopolysaccharide export system protein LptA
MHAERGGQVIDADLGIARLTADEERLETMELRGNSRIVGAPSAAGGLERMTGRDIDLTYGPDGQTIQRAVVTGESVLSLSGARGTAGRRIEAATIDITLAADGSTPTGLAARQSVQFTLPGSDAGGSGSRVIRSQAFDSRGDAEHGLTSGRFAGDVQYREQGASQAGQGTPDRQARSATLDVELGAGMASIDEARFARNVRFDEGAMSATAAAATYLLGPGTLALSGSEPGAPRPHLVNERLTVDAARIDIVLAGPQVTAVGAVASELKPAKKEAGTEAVMPSMLDGDQPVSVSAERLVYDGAAGRATYTGNALLWQGDTSIKGASLRLDEKTGDLVGTSVEGSPVVTTSAFDQKEKDGKVTRARSITTAKDFLYEEALRRATYTGDGHMSGPQGDLTAARIELYLKPAGDELERAEGYDSVTLVEKNRKTTGSRMTYFSADQRYVMTGTPVTITDECGRETTGRTLTFFQATDRIVVDGNQEMRTQTRGGGSNCK